jgi:D-alanyl-lipoteichoic acid acyltransferase DltB (MBOAT superfamily)
MSLVQLLILLAAALSIWLMGRFNRSAKFRRPLMLLFSVGIIFWLQPALPIRGLDFWLPVGTLLIVLISWAVTAAPEERGVRKNLRPVLILSGTILALGLTRLFSATALITPSRPPQVWLVALILAIFCLAFLLTAKIKTPRKWIFALGTVGLILLLVFLKLPWLTLQFSQLFRGMAGQSIQLASALDIRWLGFSYVAFRLIHTLRDRQTGRLPGVSLEEYFIYILFFPAFTAGPIDRLERFLKDLRNPVSPSTAQLGEAGRRLITGAAKKFILADLLAMIALNGVNAVQVTATGWAWVLLYAYAFQILFDFSGYTDIAIGLGGIMGIHLPENFNQPYLKPSLTQFWNNWHMTLTQWFRAYFFNPLTRAMRSVQKPAPVWVVILVTQLSTMVLIGLWHGITLNFVAWGLWHGVGMFVNNRWSDLSRPWTARLQEHPKLNFVSRVFSTILTFHFVVLGWVWFALPSIDLSMQTFSRLFGAGG